MDGIVKGKLGRVGIGGILRNSMGVFICIFLVYIGIWDLNEVEFIVIVFV